MNKGPFGNCKQAALHQIQQIQSYGGLIAIDKRSHIIIGVSSNIEYFIGKDPQQLQGQPWTSVLTPNMVNSMFLPEERDTSIAQVMQAQLNGQLLEVSNHCVEHYCLVEMELASSASHVNSFSLKTDFLKRLSQTAGVLASAKLVMNEIANYIDFDRVMLYRFLPDWHGEVVAERNKPGIEGFLGLHFPESDIPANARRLFTLNLQRLIADVNSPAVAVELFSPEASLDLTWAQLRAVHPVHIQYLKNMGVEASFSLSIVCGGKLWGMIACHHLEPKMLNLSQRQHCEELVRISALHMNSEMSSLLEQKRGGYRIALSEIRGAINTQTKGFNAINGHINELRHLFNADGIWHYFEGRDYLSGNVPDNVSLSLLKNWVDSLDHNQVSSIHSIPDDLAKSPALIRFCSGLLHIPLNKDDFILVMRQEQVETVQWAGKPHTFAAENESVLALTPRSSFNIWSQELKGQSHPWHILEIESAQVLRTELIEYLEQSEIEAMALTDPLTGLANRLLFERQLEKSLKHAIEEDQMFAVYMIDLDHFKPINDTMGHAAGDEVLVQVSRRMSDLLRDEDTVARLGGDEFAVILNTVHDQDAVDDIAQRILKEIKSPIQIAGQKVVIGASIGVSICPLDAATQAELMADADMALYEVKKEGRNGFKRFERSMMSDKQALESNRALIEAAFSENQFELRYQPLVDVRGHTLLGFEAFCIWNHPTEGCLNAQDYVELIERNQLAIQWAEWGLRALFSQYQQWFRGGLNLVPLSLNLTAKQFLNLDISGLCHDLAQEYQVGASWLRLDVDEQALIMSSRRAEEKINKLSEQGILVNIDHFGRGLVSLRQLTELKIHAIKITSRFLNTSTLNTHKGKRELDIQIAIFKSISKIMNVPLIMTQIEDMATLEKVKQQGINHVQGYITADLMTVDEATEWLCHPAECIENTGI